ncbi:MAG TPA: hypothetical protein VK550_29190 [Polyangiaceae bacterium]|nr:hypothetical protein [Polyangiaceae bacterium]
MRRCCTAKFPAWLGILGCLGAPAAHAADLSCSAITVEADAALRARWPGLLQRVRDELTGREDIDVCARVELSGGDDLTIGVEVTLPDGRSASRIAMRREDVVATLQALLVLPERAATRAAPVAKASPVPRNPSGRPSEANDRVNPIARDSANMDHDVPAPSAAHQPRRLGAELSVIGGARIGDGQTSYGLGALSFLDIGGWLVGFQGRVDRYRSIAGDSPEAALELAVLAGKRIQFRTVALDLTVGPAVAVKGIAFSETVVAPVGTTTPEMPMSEPGSGPVPRLLVGVRVGFSPRSVFRTFIGFDGELGPPRATSRADTGLTRLPIWTLGLALGGTVGTE